MLLAAGAGRPGRGLDAGRVGKVIEALERSGLAAAALARRLEEIVRAAREHFEAMDFGFLYDEPRQLFAIGYRVSRWLARRRALRPPGLRGAPHQLRRHRSRRCPRLALVPPRAAHDSGGAGHRAGVVVRLDVRVPHAGSRHALPRRKPARPDVPAGGAAAAGVCPGPRGSVGHLGVRLQRAGPRSDLSVLELRRARPGPGARARRGPRHRALCHGPGRDVRRPRRRAELRRAGARGRAGRVWVLRGAGLHALRASRRHPRGGDSRLHGPPSGHDGGRAGQRPPGRRACASASTPSPSSRPPSCCCRSGRPATCRSCGPAAKRCARRATSASPRRPSCAASPRPPSRCRAPISCPTAATW